MSNRLTMTQGQRLLELARKTILHHLGQGRAPAPHDDPSLLVPAATFVTLTKNGQLRGCIGNLEPVGPLEQGVRDNAVNAAFNDYRFSPLTLEEFPEVELHISVLSSPELLSYQEPEDLPAKLRPTIDGVILRDGTHRATFLPQVWQQLATPEEFLSHLCRKAGLDPDAWRRKKLEIHTYQVQSFAEGKN